MKAAALATGMIAAAMGLAWMVTQSLPQTIPDKAPQFLGRIDINGASTTTYIVTPHCEDGWSLVYVAPGAPKCAHEIKDPIW